LILLASLATHAAPAMAADEPIGVLAAPPLPQWNTMAWLKDAGVATATSGAVLGLAWLDAGKGPLGALGPIGQLALIGSAGVLPPAVMVALGPSGFRADDYMAGLSGGLVGLGLGYMLTAGLGGRAPTAADGAIKAAAMAIGQGLGSATGVQLFQLYRPVATDLDRLPETRTDDPIDDWNLRRERQNP
jgi:hypothetical protein